MALWKFSDIIFQFCCDLFYYKMNQIVFVLYNGTIQFRRNVT